MKLPAIAALFVACSLYISCKPEHINPAATDTLKIKPKDPQTQLSVAGVWTWSAQYGGGEYELYLLNPANTGVKETLTLNADSTWTQTENGSVANSGTYKLVNVYTTVGIRVFIKIINKNYPNGDYSNFLDFSAGFNVDYACSSDSLIFAGAYNMPTIANVAVERIYVK